jgi:hypothetical protein
MTHILTITADGAEYSDRLRELLEDYGVTPDDDEVDELGLIPAFVLGGASVRTEAHAHGDHMHVVTITVEIAEELIDPFYATLTTILEADDEDEEEGPGG